MAEATDDRANPNNYNGGYRFVGDPPITDWATKAQLDRAAAWQEALGDNANMNGLIFPVRKVVDLPAAE